MKKTKKAKAGVKTKKLPVRASAMRDLELLDPAAKQVKGGVLQKRQRDRTGR